MFNEVLNWGNNLKIHLVVPLMKVNALPWYRLIYNCVLLSKRAKRYNIISGGGNRSSKVHSVNADSKEYSFFNIIKKRVFLAFI